jgi:hypothetical protein
MALKQSAAMNKATSGGKVSENVKATVVRVLAVVLVFIALELPGSLVQILGVMRNYGYRDVLDYNNTYKYLLSASYLLGTINSFVNFYIYCLIGTRFRDTLKQMLSCGESRGKARGEP